MGRPARTPLECTCAAVLACGPGAALSHASAMCLHELWRFWNAPYEVTLPAGDRRPRGIIVHRSRTLERHEIVICRGIPVTSPARTLFDMAPRLSDKQLPRAVNNALHAKLLTRSQLAATVDSHPGHPAISRLAWFLETNNGITRSNWEREFPAFCARHGLPQPVMAAPVAGHTVDALWPDVKVIVELDSWDFHNTRLDFETDRDRDADTSATGHLTVRVTAERLEDDERREAARLHRIREARAGPRGAAQGG